MPTSEIATNVAASPVKNSARRVLFASLIGTTIEFFDFYIYATAAVLVFPALFFPEGNHTTAVLQSFATFALAFFARPIGSALFGHFGDRIGRKATLVAALLTMGISTVVIGLLPTYHHIGVVAPILLALCRLGQGLGLGGEWGGAVLLATENAPAEKRGWYGMFPQLGAPLGFLLATLVFLVLSGTLDKAHFMAWGWRIPFLLSSALVALGLWVRLSLVETPEFQRVLDRDEREHLPILALLRNHLGAVLAGMCALLATFVLFYLMTVFTLSWGTEHLGYSRSQFLLMQMAGVVFFGLLIPLAAIHADRYGAHSTMMVSTAAIFLFGLLFPAMFVAGNPWLVLAFLALGLSLMGLTYGACGTFLAEMFPTAVRYTGASLAFNLAGIFGASLAPYISIKLATAYGIGAVAVYLCAAAAITLIALFALRAKSAKPTTVFSAAE